VLSYAVVTPARNERQNLPRLAESLLAQEQRPARWVIVDDGSDDGTREYAAELAAAHDWIRLHDRRADRAGAVEDGRREGRDLLAFRAGIAALDAPSDIVVKLDADLSFGSDYFRRLVDRFAADPELGIASGVCTELRDGEWEICPINDGWAWCASRAYRHDLLGTVLDLEPRTGWDALDLVKAQLRGFTTTTFYDLPFRHHRQWGGRERGRLRAYALEGQACWYMRYRPSYLLLRTAYRGRREPAAVGLVLGYITGAVTRVPTCRDREVIPALRDRQRLSRVLAARR
jgi:glycosyltransferase involved in cell wall biosynthesis